MKTIGYYDTLCLKMAKSSSSQAIFHKRLKDDLNSLSDSDKAEKASVARILEAYIVWRNTAIGYQRGLCELVARILKVMRSEEDTFWTLAMIVEVYLPPNFFVGMRGARR